MLKTPRLGPVAAAMILAAATFDIASPIVGGGAMARDHTKDSVGGLNAWDGRPLGQDGVAAVGAGDPTASVTTPSWADSGLGEFAGASRLANLGPMAEGEPLPLSQVARSHTKPAPAHATLSVLDIVNRVRYGRLPEPASWALLLIGFGMIGAALRGFVVASRRLARLQPDKVEEVEP